MRAVTLDGYGGTEVLKVTDVAAPELGPDDLLVDRAAAQHRGLVEHLGRIALLAHGRPRAQEVLHRDIQALADALGC